MLLRDAGFDTQAMAGLFQKLAQAGRYYETGAPSWLRSHPLTSERIADVQTRIQSLATVISTQRMGPSAGQTPRAEPASEESLEFAWIRQRLEATAVRSVDGLARMAALLAARRSDPGSASAHDQARIAYGQAWVALLQRDLPAVERFLADSRLAAGQAKEPMGLPAETAAGSPRLATVAAPFWAVIAAQAHLIAGQPAPALERVEQALAVWPQSVSTRPLVRTAIEAELLLQRPLAALARARWLTSQWPEDLEAWRLQSQAAAASTRLTEAHAAQAERYWLQGALSAALEQFALARKAGDSDFVSLSQIDAKMTTLRAQILRLKEETR
jgi:predicted Zn-dependent protease